MELPAGVEPAKGHYKCPIIPFNYRSETLNLINNGIEEEALNFSLIPKHINLFGKITCLNIFIPTVKIHLVTNHLPKDIHSNIVIMLAKANKEQWNAMS